MSIPLPNSNFDFSKKVSVSSYVEKKPKITETDLFPKKVAVNKDKPFFETNEQYKTRKENEKKEAEQKIQEEADYIKNELKEMDKIFKKAEKNHQKYLFQ